MNTYFNTPAIFNQSASKVDREKGIISNIVVSTIGEAKGHNIHLNSKFLDDIVLLAAEYQKGIKARFGHPNICATALGTYLGRYKNYRRIDNSVQADLHLDKSAMKSPNGDLYSYVLDMAENNPDMFGASIAFKQGDAKVEFEELEGKKIEKRYATIKALYATDLVDSPAATDGLFESFHQDDFASQITMFLDENPQVFELVDSKPEILEEFLTNYKHYKSNKQMNLSDEITSLKNWITENFTAKTPENLSEKQQSIFDTLKSEFEAKLEALPKEDTELTELTEKLQTVSDANSELLADKKALQTKFEAIESEMNALKAEKTSIQSPNDPSVTTHKAKDDSFGKELLKALPKQGRKKLKSNT